MKHLVFLMSGLLFFNVSLYSQNKPANSKKEQLVQFSGVVLDQDSLTPIPYVSIMVKSSQRATVSDIYGFFSIVVSPGDELEFSSLTHKTRSYKLADTIQEKYYYAIQVLTKDTVELPMVDVYPWPSREEFKRAFMNLDLNDTDADRADRNLTREELSYLERTQGASASENYKYVMNTYYTKVYTTGQSPEMTLMNPVRWAQFIDSWRKGKLSSKKKN